jgi:beta-lactamase class A
LSGGGAGLPQPASLEVLPRRYTPSPFVPDATLQERLDESLGGQAGAYAFYVKDLTTGRGATHNSERVFNAASLFKLFIMYAVFHQESLGLVGWDDELVVTPYYDGFALTPRVTALCQALTVGAAMDAMLSVSDNAAAVLLQDLAGSGNVNASIEALGLRDSGLFETGLPVTAADLALLMEVIAIGQAVSPGASADMLRLLDHDVFENGLLAGVPEGTRVARKTGNWTDATHVAGIVFAPSGPYVFVALTSNGYERDVIEALSRVAYEHFEAAGAEP